MRSTVLALLLCGGAAAQTPSVQLIQPNIFPTTGNSRSVTILLNGVNLPSCHGEHSNRCDITAKIGGVVLPQINLGAYQSTIRAGLGTEEFAPGTADLELRIGSTTLRVPDAVTFVAPEDHETVLLPHTPGYPLDGANGSQWRVEMLLRNDSPYSLQIVVPMHPHTLVSPPPPDWFMIPPQTTADVVLYTITGPARLRLPKIAVKDLTFETRFYDQARAGTNFGTRVPTVREHEFRRGVTTIPGVPAAAGFRSTVRVFSPDGERRHFRVRVLTHPVLSPRPWDDVPPVFPVLAELLATHTVRTEYVDAPDKTGGPWSVPMASLPLPELPGNSRVQVQIDAVDGGDAPYWAYVSVTNNETQQVTLLTP